MSTTFSNAGLPMRRMEFFGAGQVIVHIMEVQSYCSPSSKISCPAQIATFAAWIHDCARRGNLSTTIGKKGCNKALLPLSH